MNRKANRNAIATTAVMLAISLLASLPQAMAGDPHFSSRSLQSAPTLPYLPDFGGQFLRGHEYPMASNAKCWVIKYQFSGTGPQVIASIQQALPSQGWTIDPSQAKSEQFTAERRQSNLTLSVRTQPGEEKNTTVATIRYIEHKPQS